MQSDWDKLDDATKRRSKTKKCKTWCLDPTQIIVFMMSETRGIYTPVYWTLDEAQRFRFECILMKIKINGRKRKRRPRGTIIPKNFKNKMSLPNYKAMKRLNIMYRRSVASKRQSVFSWKNMRTAYLYISCNIQTKTSRNRHTNICIIASYDLHVILLLL